MQLVQKFFSMESFVLTALLETLHTFERFQRHYSKDHNSHVKVGYFIFLLAARYSQQMQHCVGIFHFFPIFRLTSNTTHGIAVALRGALSGTLISFHANGFHVGACYCCWFTAFSLFVTDKTACWTNMTTNTWTGQDLHILKDSATFVCHYFTTFDKIS